MRQKRAKAYRKLMTMYSHTFGFRQPYQILVDSEMCKAAISQNTDFVGQLGVVLQGTVKPMITQCCIHELYLQGKSQQSAVDLAKTFERRKCNHREPIPGDDCLTSVIGETNKHRYVVATQSQPLRTSLRAIPGVPILHVNRSVTILEPPSDVTLRVKALAEQDALAPSTSEAAQLKAAAPQQEPTPKKKRGPKGPNPLSVKKKKPTHSSVNVKSIISKPSKGPLHEPQAGEKRTRNDDDTEKSVGGAGEAQGTTTHRRKRRRKTTSHPPPPDSTL
ncbi:Fcf1-domain-containing protein [Amylostereum chailletii]|nr:Fcf1-domain-containing protein [Amylostereum chailletii]